MGLPDWFPTDTISERELVAANYVDLALRACGEVPSSQPRAKPALARKRTR